VGFDVLTYSMSALLPRLWEKSKSLLGKPSVHIVLIALVGLLAYSNTFNSLFMWDERQFIVENTVIKNLSNFAHPSQAEKYGEMYEAMKRRYAGFLTFAINYRLHGLDVRGYHIFNLAVHISNALLVYLLLVLTFRTPFMKESNLKQYAGQIALFSSLLFVSHPVQTEAVTYVFQRLASLVAFFYLLSLVLYIKSRLSEGKGRYGLYALSFVSAVLAMKTKENAFTLPVMISLYEFLFFEGSYKRRVLWLAPMLLTMAIIPLTLADFDPGRIGEGSRGYEEISRPDYLFTQFRVIITYLRLLFLPVNQNIDYDYPMFHSFFAPEVLASFVFLSAVFAFAVYLVNRSKSGRPELRLIGFGVIWFFMALSVESSIIPIPMLINEYRMCLPSAGIAGALTAGLFVLMGWRESTARRKLGFPVLCSVVVVLSVATYSRNNVWRSEIGLWEDVVKKSPLEERAHNNLGNAYLDDGAFEKALREFRVALNLEPNYRDAYFSLGVAYYKIGRFEDAIKQFRFSLILKPNDSIAYNEMGIAYAQNGQLNDAMICFKKAIEIDPHNDMARNNLSRALKKTGEKRGEE
jgi:tetratricopeptide (TPR) repeat protein